ncbi:MAG TPA: YggS family pyridoxal phosphate-dependent enzyme [Ornithinimicrobium sp.]|uniref:YggS family pyridoxal phosphate-dependent enzyme n=1 Tax=Ornithinimicrobium sp. TaxID=1977084 RepID=UPI002B48906C|nr:YggS family pyridoxal phosphate-dependent enzyme [Ornithinimicrobium sp.]HKJ11944.1 YggS family pyridoxal phosphate-dependent enzyme [Ornithinimicrobium sp.]
MAHPPSPRSTELAERLGRVRARIALACRQVGRDPEELCLVAVTKFFPAADAATLVRLGVGDLGESRDQEAAGKLEGLGAELEGGPLPRMHMVGQVQTKKARSVVRWADVVHSVDRPKLVTALDRAVGRALGEGERADPLDVLVQVDLDGGAAQGRGGVRPQEAVDLAERVAECEHLSLRGTMAVAPAGAAGDEAALTRAFAELQQVHGLIRGRFPQAQWLSAGMSGDLEQAVGAGATHLRVGSGILGSRPPQG